MRLALVGIIVFAGLISNPLPVFADDEKAKSDSKSEKKTAEESDSNNEKPKQQNFIRKAEGKVNDYAGKAVGAIASVFFYELGKNSSSGETAFGEQLAAFQKQRTAIIDGIRKSGESNKKGKLELTRDQIGKLAEAVEFPGISKFLEEAKANGFNVLESDIAVSIRKGGVDQGGSRRPETGVEREVHERTHARLFGDTH